MSPNPLHQGRAGLHGEEIGEITRIRVPDKSSLAERGDGGAEVFDLFVAKGLAVKDAPLPIDEADVETLGLGSHGVEVLEKAQVAGLEGMLVSLPNEPDHLPKVIEVVSGFQDDLGGGAHVAGKVACSFE